MWLLSVCTDYATYDNRLKATRGIPKVMHSKALLKQDFTNLVYIWHKHDRTHRFEIVNIFLLFSDF